MCCRIEHSRSIPLWSSACPIEYKPDGCSQQVRVLSRQKLIILDNISQILYFVYQQNYCNSIILRSAAFTKVESFNFNFSVIQLPTLTKLENYPVSVFPQFEVVCDYLIKFNLNFFFDRYAWISLLLMISLFSWCKLWKKTFTPSFSQRFFCIESGISSFIIIIESIKSIKIKS